jgi:hypothetical protein
LVYEVDKVDEVYQPNQLHKPYQPMHKNLAAGDILFRRSLKGGD